MRRLFYFILPVFLIIPYLLCCGSSAASAAEEDGLKCIDVLSYDYPDDYGSVRGIMAPDRPYNIFDMPFSYGLVYYDVIFETGVSVSSAGMRSLNSGAFYSLTLQSLGSNRYRCYGQTSAAFNSLKFAFQVNSPSTANYSVTYYKFDVYTVVDVGVGDIGELRVTPYSNSHNGVDSFTQQPGIDVPLFKNFYNYGSSVFSQYTADFSSVNWRKYDYLDFSFDIRSADIYSICAYIDTSSGDRFIPFDISWGDGDAIDRNEYVGSGNTTVNAAANDFSILMRIYIPRSATVTGPLIISVKGNYSSTASGAYLKSVRGYYYTSVPSPDLTKLDQITAAIKESMSSSEADNNAAQDFTNEMTDKKSRCKQIKLLLMMLINHLLMYSVHWLLLMLFLIVAVWGI